MVTVGDRDSTVSRTMVDGRAEVACMSYTRCRRPSCRWTSTQPRRNRIFPNEGGVGDQPTAADRVHVRSTRSARTRIPSQGRTHHAGTSGGGRPPREPRTALRGAAGVAGAAWLVPVVTVVSMDSASAASAPPPEAVGRAVQPGDRRARRQQRAGLHGHRRDGGAAIVGVATAGRRARPPSSRARRLRQAAAGLPRAAPVGGRHPSCEADTREELAGPAPPRGTGGGAPAPRQRVGVSPGGRPPGDTLGTQPAVHAREPRRRRPPVRVGAHPTSACCGACCPALSRPLLQELSMTLAPLLDLLGADPGVAGRSRWPARASRSPTSRSTAGRPARAGRRPGARQRAARCSRSRPPPARPRTSSPRCAASSTPTGWPTSRPGRRCRTSGSARAATPSASGSRCCAGSTHPDPDRRRPTARSTSWSPRSAPCCSRSSKGLGDLAPVALKAGDEAPLEQVVEDLAAAAYTRTDLVERRGEFAVRGGILDVFPPTEDHPVRVEFWGDTVEEIRWFKVADQRSLEVAEHGLWAPPCREVLLTEAVRARAAALVDQLPGAVDLLGQARRGHRRRGHGVAGPGPRRRHGERARHPARRHRGRAVRPRAGPHPRPRPRRDQPGVPRRRLGQRRGRQRRARSTCRGSSAPPRSGAWPTCAPTPATPVCRGGTSARSSPTRSSPSGDDGASSTPVCEEAPRYRGSTAGGGGATCSGWVRRRLAGRRGHRGPGPGPARRRGAGRASPSPARLDADLTDLSRRRRRT